MHLRTATRSFYVRVCLLSLWIAFASLNITAQIRAQAFNFQQIDAYITNLMQMYQIPGTAIALVKDGRIIYTKGYGVRNVETGQPVTENTLFAIGSISKSFTALAISQLVDAGKIDLDHTVASYLPGFALSDSTATQTLTVRELLSQTSGLPRVDDMWLPGAPASRRQIVQDLARVKLTAQPGVLFQYSNQNHVLLGYLREQIVGQPWASHVQQHSLTPLRMDASDFGIAAMQNTPDHAAPHILDD